MEIDIEKLKQEVVTEYNKETNETIVELFKSAVKLKINNISRNNVQIEKLQQENAEIRKAISIIEMNPLDDITI